MKSRLTETLESTALTLGSAVLFSGFFALNDWLFSQLSYREGVNWIFLPAGFRIILILVLGWQGAAGIMLGSVFISRELFQEHLGHVALLNAFVSGFAPWVVLKVLENRGKVNRQLRTLTSQQLLNFTLIYAAANALTHQITWQLLGWREVNLLVDIWPMFIGDTVGALIMLYSMKWLIEHIPLGHQAD